MQLCVSTSSILLSILCCGPCNTKSNEMCWFHHFPSSTATVPCLEGALSCFSQSVRAQVQFRALVGVVSEAVSKARQQHKKCFIKVCGWPICIMTLLLYVSYVIIIHAQKFFVNERIAYLYYGVYNIPQLVCYMCGVVCCL